MQHTTELLRHTEMLNDHGTNFESIGTVTTMLIENINMQMEAEISDLLDRKMMSLYGVQHEKLDKVDVTNTTKLAKDVKNGIRSYEETIKQSTG